MHTIQITFKIWNKIKFGEAVYLIGNTAQLGNWNTYNSVRMQWSEGDVWVVDVLIPWESQQKIEYKYMVSDYRSPQTYYWEQGSNRNILLKPENIMKQQSPFLYILRDDKWQQRKIIVKLIENLQRDNSNTNKTSLQTSKINQIMQNQDPQQSNLQSNQQNDINDQIENDLSNNIQNKQIKQHQKYYQLNKKSQLQQYQTNYYLKGNISGFQTNQTQTLIKMQRKVRNLTQEISQSDIVSPDILNTLQNAKFQQQQNKQQTSNQLQQEEDKENDENGFQNDQQNNENNNNFQISKAKTMDLDNEDEEDNNDNNNQESPKQSNQIKTYNCIPSNSNSIQENSTQSCFLSGKKKQQQQQQNQQEEAYWYYGEAWIDVTYETKLKYCFIKEIISDNNDSINNTSVSYITSVGAENYNNKSYFYTDRQIRRIDLGVYFQTHDKLVLVNQQTIFDFKFSEINENLYLGPYPQGEADIQKLKENGIEAVLNLQTEEDMSWRGISWEQQQSQYQKFKIKGYNFPIIDMDYQDMSAKLIQVSQLLHLILQSYRKVYVHCTAGVFRSPQAIIGYFCFFQKKDVNSAIQYIEQKHPASRRNRTYLKKVLENLIVQHGNKNQQDQEINRINFQSKNRKQKAGSPKENQKMIQLKNMQMNQLKNKQNSANNKSLKSSFLSPDDNASQNNQQQNFDNSKNQFAIIQQRQISNNNSSNSNGNSNNNNNYQQQQLANNEKRQSLGNQQQFLNNYLNQQQQINSYWKNSQNSGQQMNSFTQIRNKAVSQVTYQTPKLMKTSSNYMGSYKGRIERNQRYNDHITISQNNTSQENIVNSN